MVDNEVHSDVYQEYQANKLKNSMKNYLGNQQLQDKSTQKTKNQIRDEFFSKEERNRKSADVDFNVREVKVRCAKNEIVERLKSIDFRKRNEKRPSDVEQDQDLFIESFKNSHSTFFPLKNINLSSNKLVFNLGNNYLMESHFPKKRGYRAPSESRIDRDSHSSMSTNLKERIQATKYLFSPKHPDIISKPGGKPLSEAPVQPDAVYQSDETSRSLIDINSKIAQLSQAGKSTN